MSLHLLEAHHEPPGCIDNMSKQEQTKTVEEALPSNTLQAQVSDLKPPQTPPALAPAAIDALGSDKVVKDRAEVDFTKGGVENYKFYPDNPENHRHKYRWAMKEPSKFYDPCDESRQASINCMLRNQEDKLVCQEFFDAYRDCRKDFFNKKRSDRIEGKKGWGIW